MRINQNIPAFNAFRNLTKAGTELGNSMEKLSSGFQINRATDDAAGLVQSENLRSEVSGTIQAIQNAQNGISFIQTAEGALDEGHSLLQRMRVLAVDAASTASSDGAAQNAELQELLAEFDAVGTRSTFAGVGIFQDFSASPLVFHVGTGSGSANELQITEDMRLDTASFAGGALAGLDLTTDADGAISALDTAIEAMSAMRSNLGAGQNRLEQTINNLQVAQENLSASESRIRDTDMALEMVTFTRNQIMTQAGTAMLAQANTTPESVLRLLEG